MRIIFEKLGAELTGSRLYGIPNKNSDWDFDITVDDCLLHQEELVALGFNLSEFEDIRAGRVSAANRYYSDLSLVCSLKTNINETVVNLLVVRNNFMDSRRKFREFMLSQSKEFIEYLYGMNKNFRKPFFRGLIQTIISNDAYQQQFQYGSRSPF